MKKLIFTLLAALLIAAASAACADVTVTFSPQNPRAGDYVDVTVVCDRDNPQTVAWSLSTPESKVFSGDPTEHFTASFRPRTEADYTLSVTVSYGKKDEETASVVIPVSGQAPVQQGPDVVYSQKDGWWHDKVYSSKYHRSLEKAGCAIFALSHALQRMGIDGDDVLPDQLAVTYKSCYIEGRGTANEILTARAGEKYGFTTADDLIESEAGLTTCLRLGDRFTFSIVIGHIAYADGLSEDGTKVHVIDSAPGATYERIKNAWPWYIAEDGSFAEAKTADELPGIRWFFETGEYGGAEYWLDLEYCAKRGMRLIRPAWLTLEATDGILQSVAPDYFGTVWSRVTAGGELTRVRTKDLAWIHDGTDGMKIARITKKNTAFVDADGKKISGFKVLNPGLLVPVLREEAKQLYVCYRGTFGYIKKANAEFLSISEEDFPTGLVSINGRTSGSSTVRIRVEAKAKGSSYYDWVVGTPLTLLEEKGNFYLAEGKGIRGWIQKEYVTPDQEEPSEKTSEGSD